MGKANCHVQGDPQQDYFQISHQETLNARKQWVDIVQVPDSKNIANKNSIHSTSIHQKLEKEEQSKPKYSRMKALMKIRN